MLARQDRLFNQYSDLSLPGDIPNLDVGRIRAIIEKSGYSLNGNGTLIGVSGSLHRFHFVCRKDGKRIAISVLASDDKDCDIVEMVKLRLKTCDTTPDMTIILKMNLASPEVRKLCNYYDYMLIEETPANGMYAQLEQTLSLMKDPF